MKKETWKLEEISADILSKDLSSHNMNMREKAEEALIKMGEVSLDSMEKIIKGDSSPVAKLGAISVLKEIKSKRSIIILLEALGDSRIQIRKKACAVIGEIESEESIPYLIDMLKLVNPDIRNSAQTALRLIGITSVNPLLNSILKGHIRQMQSAEDIIMSMGEEVTGLLMEKTEDKNNLMKALAVEFLGKLKYEKALEKIVYLLKNDRSVIVKQACIKALGEIGVTSVRKEILGFLENESIYLKETALEALRKLSREE
jgi:hypothetical protein